MNADSTINEPVEDYYMFPIRPNEVNTLAGNMGELRASHFHAGLDIRTGGRTGLPVYAAADGYISRAAVKVGGYGKALYITHPNGETTVYAHLEKFNGTIADFVKEHQYEKRSLYLNEYFKRNLFVVKKGQIIAYSGNSGSSAGPHLHFEIRDRNQQILNPLKYNFEEIRDTRPPIFQKIAITPKNINARINKIFNRKTYDIKLLKNVYTISDTVEVYGKIGFELLAHDKLNDANYKCGISEITFKIDDQLVFHQKIDTINFSSQRNILRHYNYPAYIDSGKKFHKLYLDDGNKLPFYTTNNSRGILDLKKVGIKRATIEIEDVLGNTSTLDFLIKVLPSNDNYEIEDLPYNTKIFENTLVIKQQLSKKIEIKYNNKKQELAPSYHSKNSNYYLLDLRKGIPTIEIDDVDILDFENPSIIIPNKSYSYYSPQIEATFGKNDLFDTLYFSTSYQHEISDKIEVYTIGNPSISSLRQSIDIKLKSNIERSDSSIDKTHVYQKNGDDFSFIGGRWNSNEVSFKTRNFGKYTILMDSISPSISPVTINGNSIQFKIKDNLSGINKFDVFVNNEWVLMDYDYKKSLIWSDPTHEKPFTGEIRLRVTDNAGNKQIYLTKIVN